MGRQKLSNTEPVEKDAIPTTDLETSTPDRYTDKVEGFSRDKNGFIQSIDYGFNPDNTINWRGMIKVEHLVPNRDSFKNSPDINLKEIDVSTLPDNKLLILLAGIKELAQIRGYENVEYEVIEARPDYVAVKCTINWIGNYETRNSKVSFSALADAHWDNTHNFAKNFLMAIAENRAFVRAVRNFLKINIVGSDEMGGKNSPVSNTEYEPSTGPDPVSLLQKTMNDYNISFDKIKDGAIRKGIEGAETWSNCDDVPPLSIFTIVSGIKSKNKLS
jgi:hypothetical protein